MTDIAENGYTFVDRASWGARHRPGWSPMPRPVAEVNFHHTVLPPSGAGGYNGVLDPSDDPCLDMRRTEDVLAARRLDPGYSFTIHPSGVVLEGAGRMKGAHTGGRNSRSYGISFIGNYDTHQPTLAQLVAAARTVNLLRLDGSLVPELHDVKMYGHRDHKATACPGANLYPLLRWVRWFAHTGV